jgi:putative sporulation protein YyaC
MEKFHFYWKDNNKLEEFVQILKSIISEDTVIVNVGSTYNIGDSVALMFGSMLESNDSKMDIYGDLWTSINTSNKINKISNHIKTQYDNPKIIAIDACIGRKDQIGEIHFKEDCLIGGEAINKSLTKIGDYSIHLVVDDGKKSIEDRFKDVSLTLVWDLASTLNNAFRKAMEV